MNASGCGTATEICYGTHLVKLSSSKIQFVYFACRLAFLAPGERRLAAAGAVMVHQGPLPLASAQSSLK